MPSPLKPGGTADAKAGILRTETNSATIRNRTVVQRCFVKKGVLRDFAKFTGNLQLY